MGQGVGLFESVLWSDIPNHHFYHINGQFLLLLAILMILSRECYEAFLVYVVQLR